MEFHAWFNPYRVTNNVDKRSITEKLNELAENNVARNNPDLVYEFQNKLFLDPGKPEVIDYVVSRVEEVATKYDVDAIHFDDYFYPYKYTDNGKDIFFYAQDLDKQTFLDYNRGFGEYTVENINTTNQLFTTATINVITTILNYIKYISYIFHLH